MKHFHILYVSGYAGNFLRRLLSLDLSCTPIFEIENDSLLARAVAYRQDATLQSWRKKEEEFLSKELRSSLGDYDFKVTSSHCYNTRIRGDWKLLDVSLDDDDFSNFWWVNSIKEMGDLAVYRGQYIRHRQLVEMFGIDNDHTISITKFLNKDTWFSEYSRICNVLEIPCQEEAASFLFNSWYSSRVDPIRKLPYYESNLARSMIEELGNDIWWTQFQNNEMQYQDNLLKSDSHFKGIYDRIKADSWPECPPESAALTLPDFILAELANAGYRYDHRNYLLATKLNYCGPHLPIDIYTDLLHNLEKGSSVTSSV